MQQFNPYTFWASLLGPLISALALVYAVKRGNAALKEWRIQRLIDKRAEIAGKAQLAAIRYLDVLAVMARGVELTSSEDKRTPAERFNDRWAIFGSLDNDFNEAIYLARIYLGDAEAEALDAIWKRKNRLWSCQLTYLQDNSMYEHAYGGKAAPDLDLLRENVRRFLMPHVRMEEETSDKPSPRRALLSSMGKWFQDGIGEIERNGRKPGES